MPAKPLPLVVSVSAAFEDNPAFTGAATPQTITVQLTAQSGLVYHLPLSEQAAQMLTLTLMSWAPVREFIIEKFEQDVDEA
jgi:hypothetical protein